jgi:hypothetical protein
MVLAPEVEPRSVLVFFALLPVAVLLIFRMMGPIRRADALLPFAVFYSVYGLAIFESQARLRRWWNLL